MSCQSQFFKTLHRLLESHEVQQLPGGTHCSTQTYECTDTHTHARTHARTHTHTHKQTHTHTEKHTHKPAEDWKGSFGKHTVSVHAKVISVVCAAVLDPEAHGECLIVLVYFWATILCVGVQALSPAIWIGLQWWCIPPAGITVSAGFLKANCPSVIVLTFDMHCILWKTGPASILHLLEG